MSRSRGEADRRQDYQYGRATLLQDGSLEAYLNVNIRLIHCSSHCLASDCSPWVLDLVVSSPCVMPPDVRDCTLKSCLLAESWRPDSCSLMRRFSYHRSINGLQNDVDDCDGTVPPVRTLGEVFTRVSALQY